jgi:hypothetical protein
VTESDKQTSLLRYRINCVSKKVLSDRPLEALITVLGRKLIAQNFCHNLPSRVFG